MRTLFIIPVVLMSLVSFPSWGSSSTFECSSWIFGDGSGGNKDSFSIKVTNDQLFMDGKFSKYHRVSDLGGYLTFIHSYGWGLTLFVHDGDIGFYPLDNIHLNSTIYLTEIDSPVIGEYLHGNNFIQIMKRSKCSRVF